MVVCGLSLHQRSTEIRKTLEQKLSMNAFHLTNLFCFFSRYQAPTNGVAPSFCIRSRSPRIRGDLLLSVYKPHTTPLRRTANARNVSFRISLRWPIYIVNSVDKIKLSLETYPLLRCYTLANALYTLGF